MKRSMFLILAFVALGLQGLLVSCSDSGSGNPNLFNANAQDSIGAPTASLSNLSDVQSVVADPAGDGPFTVLSTKENLNSCKYASAQVFYPEMASPVPLPATTLCCGFLGEKEGIEWLARRIASHGFIVIIFTPRMKWTLPEAWEAGHKGCLKTMRSENERAGSVLYHRIDTDRLCLAGFSMGGGGALLAARDLRSQVSNVIALHPWYEHIPVYVNINCPVLMFAGTKDTLALAPWVWLVFNALPGTADSLFIKVDGAVHHDPKNNGAFHELYSNYIIAWLQFHVAGNAAYEPFLAREGVYEPDFAQFVYRYAE